MSADYNTDSLTPHDVEVLTKYFGNEDYTPPPPPQPLHFGEDPASPVIKSPFQELAEQLWQVANYLHIFSSELWKLNQGHQFSYFLLEFSNYLMSFSRDLVAFLQGNHIPDPIHFSNLKRFSKDLQRFSNILRISVVLVFCSEQLNDISLGMSNLVKKMGLFVAVVPAEQIEFDDAELPSNSVHGGDEVLDGNSVHGGEVLDGNSLRGGEVFDGNSVHDGGEVFDGNSVLGEKRKDDSNTSDDEESDSGASGNKRRIRFKKEVDIFNMTYASPADIAAAKYAREPDYKVHRRGPNEPLDTSHRTDANTAMNR